MKSSKPRVFYIDNLRILLTFLVVLHHWAIANGAPGDWYYTENRLSEIGQLLMTMFVATNQAFFMGFFFMISAYFIPRSLERKGSRLYMKERLKRLGIPLIVYYFVLSPLVIFLVAKFAEGYSGNLFQFFADAKGIFSPGPLWFVALLLIFSLLYLVFSHMQSLSSKAIRSWSPNGSSLVIAFILLVAVTFVIRVFWPIGDWIPIIGIQPAHVTQYVLCFSIGIIAHREQLFDKLKFKSSVRWFLFAQIMIFIAFPALFILTNGEENIAAFMGGFTYQSALFTLWEQAVALSLIIGLLGISKRYFNSQNSFLRDLSGNSYAIYILHSVALVVVSLLVISVSMNSMYKFLLLAIPAIAFSYLLAKLARTIPQIRNIV